jgi:hypothetical protein
MTRLRRLIGIWLATVVAAGLGVAAASAVTETPPEKEPPEMAPQNGTEAIGARAEDPAGGPGWAVRRYTSTSGAACVEVGRYDGETFGVVDASGALTPQPLGVGATCGELDQDAALVAVNRYAAREGQPARTVLFGRSDTRVADVAMKPDATVQRDPAEAKDRTFVLVVPRLLDAQEMPLELRFDDGHEETINWR